MTDRNATATSRGTPSVQARIPPETQARALLRLVPPVDPGSDAHALRLARADAQAIAERRPFGDRSSYLYRARVALRDLRRLASVDGDEFARECAAVDASERSAMAAAMAMATLMASPVQGPRPPPK